MKLEEEGFGRVRQQECSLEDFMNERQNDK